MHNFDLHLENSRSTKPLRPGGHPGFGQAVNVAAREEESKRIEGMKIAQTAVQSIGMSTRDPWGPPISLPQYALAVSRIFTKATNQTIMLNTPPDHVCSTSHLWASLAHDKRFDQIPMSEAAHGDIIIASHPSQADGYAGIVVDHGRIVSNSTEGVRDDCSLAEIQRSRPDMAAFRYVGFWNYYRSKPLANAGFNPAEARIPAGQAGGGQWTAGGAGGAQNSNGQLKMAPSTVGLSAGDQGTAFSARTRPGPMTKTADHPALDYTEAYLGEIGEVWKGYGDAITDTVTGLWNAVRHPIDTAKGVAKGVTQIVQDPVGVLKAIGQQVAADFTSGDPRKAGKLIGQVLIAAAGTEVSTEKLASLIPKVVKAASGEAVSFTPEETGLLQKLLDAKAAVQQRLAKGASSPVVADGGLQASEDAGGHLLAKHVGQTDGQLMSRAMTDPKTPEVASSFFDRATAETAASQAIDANAGKITKWLGSGESKPLVIRGPLNRSVGKIVTNEGASSTTSSSTFVLVRDPKVLSGYHILTGYPD